MPAEKYSRGAGDPRALPGDRASSSTSTATPASRPRSPSCAGTTPPRAGSSSTNRGDAIRARFVVHRRTGRCTGRSCPGIPGIETFEGHAFHTSRWDYAYTGGDANGNLTGLRDKRVGIIGTGATAVQCVPHLGDERGAALRVPAHAVVDRRARQPPDRSRVGARRSSPAGSSSGWTTSRSLTAGGFARRGPGERRLDRHHRASCSR